MNVDFTTDSLGKDHDGHDVFLQDIWPSVEEVEELVASSLSSEVFRQEYADVYRGDAQWRSLLTPQGDTFPWDEESTYVRRAPFLDAMDRHPAPISDIRGARVLMKLGDSVTTDHISPVGFIKPDSPAGTYLLGRGVDPRDFNSFGSRRGNHEVMVRGAFGNIRLRNHLAPGTEGGFTQDFTARGKVTTVFEAAENYARTGTPLVVLAGKEYGSGSSRDWAAKGTALLGVKAVVAESYERIHRSNLVGMGVLPLEFLAGESSDSLGLTGQEVFDVTGIVQLNDRPLRTKVKIRATPATGTAIHFEAAVRLDTPREATYFRHGGIMPFVMRQVLEL